MIQRTFILGRSLFVHRHIHVIHNPTFGNGNVAASLIEQTTILSLILRHERAPRGEEEVDLLQRPSSGFWKEAVDKRQRHEVEGTKDDQSLVAQGGEHGWNHKGLWKRRVRSTRLTGTLSERQLTVVPHPTAQPKTP